MNDTHTSVTGIDIIVPVYGGWTHVERCLSSLEAQTSHHSVIVVDDASPDDTADRIAERFPHITLLRNETNVGFARSCNRGIAAGSGDVVVLLNSDVCAEPMLVEKLTTAFAQESARNAGSASPLLMRPDGKVDALGITADVTLAGFVRFHGSSRERASRPGPKAIGPYGALAAYRRSALAEVGLLDENIFMYGEELELAYRLASAGWRTFEIDEPMGVHIGGASAGSGSARQRYLAGFGRGYTIRVYDVLRRSTMLRTLITELIVVGRGALVNRDLAQLKGRLDGWRKGRGEPKRVPPTDHLERSITFPLSLRMRSNSFWGEST